MIVINKDVFAHNSFQSVIWDQSLQALLLDLCGSSGWRTRRPTWGDVPWSNVIFLLNYSGGVKTANFTLMSPNHDITSKYYYFSPLDLNGISTLNANSHATVLCVSFRVLLAAKVSIAPLRWLIPSVLAAAALHLSTRRRRPGHMTCSPSWWRSVLQSDTLGLQRLLAQLQCLFWKYFT